MAISQRERVMLIVLGVVAVAALAFFLLVRGGGEPEEPAPAASPPPPAAEPSPEPTTEPEDGRPRPPRTFTFFGGRDPFVPLIEEPDTAGTTNGTTDGGTDGDTNGDTNGDTDGDGTTDGDDDPSFTNGDDPSGGKGAGSSSSTVKGGKRVVLIDIFQQDGGVVAQVSVDGRTFIVGEGERFAGSFEVTSIRGSCASFLFGDESFTLCEGPRPK